MINLQRSIGYALNRGSRGFAAVVSSGYGDHKSVISVRPAIPAAEPGIGEVKVKIQLSRVSIEDVRSISGASLVNHFAGLVGTTGVGTVAASGSGNGKFSKGDNVLVVRPGVWNNEVIVPDKYLFPVPGNLSKEQLASVDAVASAIGVLNFGGLAVGDVIILDNATDVLNAAIIGVAKARKFRALVQQSGGSFVSATDTDKVDAASLKAKLVVTSHSGASFNQLAGHLAFGGSVVCVNGGSAPISSAVGVSASVRNLVFNDLRIHGADFTAWAHANPISCARAVVEAAKLLSAGQIVLPAPKSYASNDAVAALDAAAQGQLVSMTF